MLYEMDTHCSPNASPLLSRAASAAAKEFRRSYTTTTRR
uniref:CZOG1 n=1 Tax=Arundo donax TaxID=35708 RepID=A0A0A8Z4E4_ARUDO